MKYYIIVGEASGDLHASNLMKALQKLDAKAEFRFFGGDLMAAVGGERVKHYKDLAYMAFIPVLLHLRTILTNMSRCKHDVEAWNPDMLILVDYPGFNLSIAKYIKSHTSIPIYYYISPKIWAWKEHRIKSIRRDVDELFSILPFEVQFYKGHNYPIHYVGNPCVDAVSAFSVHHPADRDLFLKENGLDSRPIVALLAGSRKQEIEGNLPKMLKAMAHYPQYQPVIAGAPGMDAAYYEKSVPESKSLPLVFGQTYRILQHSHAALVTSGTATLETALFRVPQVVCYHTPIPKVYAFLRRMFIKVKYISLVNLIAGDEIVRELVADTMTVENVTHELGLLLPQDGEARQKMLGDYDRMIEILGPAGASEKAAAEMLKTLNSIKTSSNQFKHI